MANYLHHLITLGASGSMLSACGSGPYPDAPFSDWAAMVNGFQKSALETRLGIPLLYGIDAIHGNGSIRGATVFPHNVGLGATRFSFRFNELLLLESLL